MGMVINFQAATRVGRAPSSIAAKSESAAVIILPVIRIDRGPDGSNGLEPDTGNNAGRRRRRRAVR